MLTLDLDLDDEEEEVIRPILVEEPAEPGFFTLGRILTFVLVLALGGGLGTAFYFLSDLDSRDVIAMLDIGEGKGPRLKLPLMPAPAEEAQDGSAAGVANAVAPAVATKPDGQAAVLPVKPVELPPIPAMPASRGGKPPSYADLPNPANAAPLPAAPVKELLAEGPKGALPVIAPDGRQSWKVYARPTDGAKTGPKVAVIITDLGLDRLATEAVIARMPPDASLAFSPYAPDLGKWIKKARDAGHEALVMLPVEPEPALGDLGPLTLTGSLGAEEMVGRLETLLAKAPGVVGVVASRPLPAEASPVLSALKARGLMLVGASTLGQTSLPANAPVSLAMDSDLYREAIDARLAGAAQSAKANGALVISTGVKPIALVRLAAWTSSLPGQGLAMAPVSALSRPPASK